MNLSSYSWNVSDELFLLFLTEGGGARTFLVCLKEDLLIATGEKEDGRWWYKLDMVSSMYTHYKVPECPSVFNTASVFENRVRLLQKKEIVIPSRYLISPHNRVLRIA